MTRRREPLPGGRGGRLIIGPDRRSRLADSKLPPLSRRGRSSTHMSAVGGGSRHRRSRDDRSREHPQATRLAMPSARAARRRAHWSSPTSSRSRPRLSEAEFVDGDARCASVAAASIIPRYSRPLMVDGPQLSEYGFARHKGYATPEHLGLDRWGRAPAPAPLPASGVRRVFVLEKGR